MDLWISERLKTGCDPLSHGFKEHPQGEPDAGHIHHFLEGGVGKTTTAANLGGLVADAGLRVLLLDLDVQPRCRPTMNWPPRPGGIFELLAFNERAEQLISRTTITGLDLILSNDDRGELNTLLLHAADGRLRLRHLLPTLVPQYDLVLIDTQGARSVLLEMGYSPPMLRFRR